MIIVLQSKKLSNRLEYKITKLLSQIRVEASRCYNQMMTPVVGLRNFFFK